MLGATPRRPGLPKGLTGNNRPGRAVGQGAGESAGPGGEWRREAAGRASCRNSGRLHGLRRLAGAGVAVQTGVPPSRRVPGQPGRPQRVPDGAWYRQTAPPAIPRSTSASPGQGIARQRGSPLLFPPSSSLDGRRGTASSPLWLGRAAGAGAYARAPLQLLERPRGERRARCRRAGHTCRPLSRRLRAWTAEGTGWEGAGLPPSSTRRWRRSVQPPLPAAPPQPGAAVPRPERPGVCMPFPPGPAGYELQSSAPHGWPQRGSLLREPGARRSPAVSSQPPHPAGTLSWRCMNQN